MPRSGTPASRWTGELVVLRLELAAAAAGSEGGDAVVRVVPVGSARPWADRLVAMYEAWADRTARETARDGDDGVVLTISGPATLDLLAHEAGLHRHVRPDGSEELARVLVDSPAAPSPVAEADPGAVVRVYEEGRRRVVRDPRTGVRESHVRAGARGGARSTRS